MPKAYLELEEVQQLEEAGEYSPGLAARLIDMDKPASGEERDFLLWFAGFFDGEGTISIQRNRRRQRLWSPSYCLIIRVYNTDKATIELIRHHLPEGHVAKRLRIRRAHKPYYEWYAQGNKALAILRRLYPFLVTKKEKATLAIKFQEDIHLMGQMGYDAKGVPFGVAKRWEDYYQRMKDLNRKGEANSEELSGSK